MATMTTKRFNKMETFLNWTSKHKQCLIILYLTLIHLIPKRDALQFIFMQNTSNRLHAALEALKTRDYKIPVCVYYFSSSKNRYRTLIPYATLLLLLQLFNNALGVKVFIKITETVQVPILNYSSIFK